MSGTVKKIFIVLIIIVACVLLGALVLNVLFPNAAKTVVNAMEDMVFKATGMSFDWNGDGQAGAKTHSYKGDAGSDEDKEASGGVDGFN